jgi:hypothetical protein
MLILWYPRSKFREIINLHDNWEHAHCLGWYEFPTFDSTMGHSNGWITFPDFAPSDFPICTPYLTKWFADVWPGQLTNHDLLYPATSTEIVTMDLPVIVGDRNDALNPDAF